MGPPPPPWRSPMSFPTARLSPSATRGSGAPRLSSSPASSVWSHAESTRRSTNPSGSACTPTPSFPEAPPCTPVLLTVCRRRSLPWLPPPSRSRSSLPPRGSTPSGSEAPSWLPSPPSSRCGSPSRSTTSAAPPSSTASASKRTLTLQASAKRRGKQYWIKSPPSSSTCQWGYSLFSIQPFFHHLAIWGLDHSAVYNIPSSTLIFTFFLQDISLRDFCTFINCLLELS